MTTENDGAWIGVQSVNHSDARIGQRLKRRRLAAKLKASWVAGQLGVTPQMISLLEQGKRYWSAERVEQYRKAIGD